MGAEGWGGKGGGGEAFWEAGLSSEADSLKAEIDVETEEFLTLVQVTAGQSLVLRSLTGSLLPTSPGQLRQEQEMIQAYWNAGDYADSLRIEPKGWMVRSPWPIRRLSA